MKAALGFKPVTDIRDYDFHPPDEVRVFSMPASGVRRLDDDAFVAEVRYGA